MLEITKENIEKAVERAKQSNLLVKTIQFRTYKVTNRTNGKSYTVNFYKVSGKKFAECDCPATVICKHIGGSIGWHVVLAEQIHRQTV